MVVAALGVLALLALPVLVFLGWSVTFSTDTVEPIEGPAAASEASWDADGTYRLTPTASLGGSGGCSCPVTLDLTKLTPADFAEQTVPGEWYVDADGRVEVIVPGGVRVAVEASTGAGRIEVFGQTTDSGPVSGAAPGSANASHPVDDPHMELFLTTSTGDIEVRQG